MHATEVMSMQNKMSESLTTQKESKLMDFSEWRHRSFVAEEWWLMDINNKYSL